MKNAAEAALSEFDFAAIAPDLAKRLGMEDLPIPVRKSMVSNLFGPDEVRLRDVLNEIDLFVQAFPRSAGAYREPAGKLAMIAATEYLDRGNIKAALICLSTGLRIAPDNMILRVHQALALQMNGYHGAAADEYAQILNFEPQAYDPTLRVLAAKAYAGAGEWEAGLRILMYLPEEAFADPGLANLRNWLVSRGAPMPERAKTLPKRFCTKCGSSVKAAAKFCTDCGTPVRA